MELFVRRLVLLHALFSAWCTAQQRTGDGRVILNLGYITSYSGDFISGGTVPAAQLAVDRINNDSRILPEYYLQLQAGYDSKCNADVAFDEYFRFWTSTYPNQTAPIFLGGGCSVATEPMLTAARFWRTMQVSYVSSAPHLSDKKRFPYHFRLLPSETSSLRSQGVFVSQFGWDKVTMIVQNEELFVSNSHSILEYMQRDLGITTVNAFRFVSQLPVAGIDQALGDGPRVIIVNAYQRLAREVLCELYKHNRYYPFYQIIIPGWFDDSLWKETEARDFNYTSDCSLSDIHIALNNVIAINDPVYPRNTSIVGLSGWSADSFTDEYRAFLESTNNTVLSPYGLTVVDAVYVAALAMNASVPRLRELGLELEGFRFEDYNKSAIYADILKEEAGKLDFQGLKSRLSFDSLGEPTAVRVVAQQYRLQPSGVLTRTDIGEINLTSHTVELLVSIEEVFPSGTPTENIVPINIILFSVMSALAVIGVTLSVVCLLFNIIFMRKKYIKLTSPHINVVICLGAILLYGTMVLLGVPTTDIVVQSALCNASTWVPTLGFTLLFGSLVVKTWRIYYIFRQINARKFTNKARFKPWVYSWLMLVVVGVMVVGDLVFFVIVTSIDSSRFYATEQRTALSRDVVLTCTSGAYSIVLAVLLIYKSIYLWVGLFLAFETRKVNIEALNDARFIGLSVYCCVLTCIPLVPIGILLSTQHQARYGVLAGGIFFAVTVILCLLFIPKMVGLYRRRNNNAVDATLEFEEPPVTMSTIAGLQQTQVTALQDEIEELKKKLHAYELKTSNSAQVLANGNTISASSAADRTTRL